MSRRVLPLIPTDLAVVRVLPAPDRVTIVTVPKRRQGVCPLCGVVSGRIHSHCNRTLADLPWQGRFVAVQGRARRFRCTRLGCPRRIFTERFPDVAPPRARRTARPGDVQRRLGFALGGAPGSRLAARLPMPPSGDTLLRLIGTAALEPHPPPRVAGIDDWPWRRGQRHGTLVCDLERGRVIDGLPGRSAEAAAGWRQPHPGVAAIARDRAGAYAEGARQGAPDAVQVADRRHLLRNPGEAVQAAVEHGRAAVGQAARLVRPRASLRMGKALPGWKRHRRSPPPRRRADGRRHGPRHRADAARGC